MTRFFKLVSVSMQESLHFRAAFLFNLATPFIILAGQFMLWSALYSFNNGQDIGAYSRSEMFTYILLTFFIINLLTWGSENIVSRKIVSGSIVTNIVRPFPFLLQNIADMIGPMILQAIVNTVFVSAVYVAFSKYFIGTQLIPFVLFFISLILGLIIRILFISTFGLLCFYTTSYLGLSWTRGALMDFFSGAVVPVALFPELLKKITYFTPFPYILQTPVSIFMQKETYYPIGVCFFIQICWIAVFVFLQSFFWKRVSRNIIVAGG